MTICPSCGSPLPVDAPAGLCPACLARAARGEARTTDPGVVEAMRRTLAAHAPELEIGELIGRGGMGFVFRGQQKRLGRDVAVKVLDPELSANPLFADRFAREAQTLARLAHRHIVTVHDYGRAGELFYLVLEYVDGVNLRQVLRAGKLAPEQALAIVPQLCDALQFAHEHGVVHRDVKPENILLDRAGLVKITDFGLAKLLGVEATPTSLTSTGQVLGTLRYMAPEQMDRPLHVDHRADIYSLGVVFYEMLTGEIPMGRFAPPSKKVRIDVQLDEVVLRTLEREPELRYQHANEVKTDMEAIEAGRTLRDDRREEPRKVSRLAVASVGVGFGGQLVVACGIVPLLLLGEPSSSSSVDGGSTWHSAGSSTTDALLEIGPFVILAALSLAVMGVAGVLGRAAIKRIREHWPRLYGVGAAVTGVWFLPLFVFNCAVLTGIYLACTGLSVDPPPEIMEFGGFSGIVCDVFWIARRRAVLLLELNARLAT